VEALGDDRLPTRVERPQRIAAAPHLEVIVPVARTL
jgi:hypothetical protein